MIAATRFKTQPWRSQAYTAFVRSRPCIRCGSAYTFAHHWAPVGIGGKGTSRKHDDWATVSVCKPCHDEWHQSATMAGWEPKRCREEFTLALLRTMGDWIAQSTMSEDNAAFVPPPPERDVP